MDYRPDAISLGALKHFDPHYVDMTAKIFDPDSFWWWPKSRTTRFKCSLELLSQLLVASNISLTLEPKLVFEKLNHMAKSINSVNLSRYEVLEKQFVITNTVILAYAMYRLMVEQQENLNFPRPQKSTP